MYVSAGLLLPHDLQLASTARWNTFTTTADDVDAGLDPWERRIYQDALGRSGHVLLVGCGAGRDLIALGALGYEVTGLDVSTEITALAREHLARRGLTAKVLTGFIEDVDPGGPFDAIILSSRCYGCIRGGAARQSTLTRLASRLTPAGRVIISYAMPVREAHAAMRLTTLAAMLTRAGWRPERGDRFTCDYLAPRVLRYEHLFEPADLARECAAAGLTVLRDEAIGGPFRCLVAARR
jgi:SAM-dependent methyltransferase